MKKCLEQFDGVVSALALGPSVLSVQYMAMMNGLMYPGMPVICVYVSNESSMYKKGVFKLRNVANNSTVLCVRAR